jgi:hypothetical protein
MIDRGVDLSFERFGRRGEAAESDAYEDAKAEDAADVGTAG